MKVNSVQNYNYELVERVRQLADLSLHLAFSGPAWPIRCGNEIEILVCLSLLQTLLPKHFGVINFLWSFSFVPFDSGFEVAEECSEFTLAFQITMITIISKIAFRLQWFLNFFDFQCFSGNPFGRLPEPANLLALSWRMFFVRLWWLILFEIIF